MKKRENPTKNKLVKFCGFAAAMLIAALNFTDEMIYARSLDGAVYTRSSAFSEEEFIRLGESSERSNALFKSMSVSTSGDEILEASELSVRLFGMLKVASVSVYNAERAELVPRGDAIGISIHTDGVIVVGFGDIALSNGEGVCPAKNCGLRAGDVIKKLNGRDVCTSNELQLALNSSSGDAEISVERAGKLLTVHAEPVIDANGGRRLGAWVRDSTIGIGTLSFSDAACGSLAALGHAVLDADTQTVLPVLSGSMAYADILGVVKGKAGAPGELKGTFSSKSEQIGTVRKNSIFGVFGELTVHDEDGIGARSIPLAFPDEVHTGEALIYSQLDSLEPQSYSCRIIRTLRQKQPEQKGLVLEITDPRLLDAAGGIVQGMSGSPIIQDGRLVGVVTHVFVNDPTKGYGAYAFWIYEAMRGE